MRQTYRLEEIDNRDSNTTWLHLNDKKTTLEIDFDELVRIMISFMENSVEGEPEIVKKMIETVESNIHFAIDDYLP